MAKEDTAWTADEIASAAQVTTSDVFNALALIREASPELAEMVLAEESEP